MRSSFESVLEGHYDAFIAIHRKLNSACMLFARQVAGFLVKTQDDREEGGELMGRISEHDWEEAIKEAGERVMPPVPKSPI